MSLERWLVAAALLAASTSWGAQYALPDPSEWAEEAPPAAPTFSKDHLLPIRMPPHVSVKVGVDPETISVGGDGVVRYVVVMSNASGTVNAAFEGIRCTTDEVKTYARYGTSGEWRPVSAPQWQELNGNQPSKHALAIARQGACENRLSTSKAQVIDALKQKTKPPISTY